MSHLYSILNNAKEQDSATGWYYYGARYDARPELASGSRKVSRWLSVDPLAEKYTAFSPYNYVMNYSNKYCIC